MPDPTVDGMHVPFSVPECRIVSAIEQGSNHLTIEVLPNTETCCCPGCGQASRSVHSRYRRRPADLPVSASRTTLSIRVRRFHCRNPCCRRRTFAEPVSDLLGPRARRTRRLAETQGRVGIACGGAPGARLLEHLRMPASRATVLRLVRTMPMPDAPAPVRVGVDDGAMRKGCRYGTIVVDLDRHRGVDLLPDGTAATLAGWLGQRTDIRVVARDRSTEYARGAGIGAPRAVQVADRRHDPEPVSKVHIPVQVGWFRFPTETGGTVMWTDEQRAKYRRPGGGFPSDVTDAEWAVLRRLQPSRPYETENTPRPARPRAAPTQPVDA